MSEPEIRIAQADDLSRVSGLLRVLHPDMRDDVRLGTVRQDSRVFVAELESQVVGCLVATLTDYGLSRYGMIEELVVHDDHQRTGVGAGLIAACAQWMTQNQIEVIFVSAKNESAEGYYRRHGFVQCTGPWLHGDPERLARLKQGQEGR
jgi:N-acetylglutamate synthase-like GNAT family acetyltransferase